MSSLSAVKQTPSNVRERVSAEEWEVRVKLAAAYRLAALFRWTDHIYTHFSARVPGPEEHFLINAFGLLFDEISASNLVKVDVDGSIIDDPLGLGINQAGYVIHSAIHRARPDLKAVLHTHTRDGAAVSAQRDGLLRFLSMPWRTTAGWFTTIMRAWPWTWTSSSDWWLTWATATS